MNLMGNDVNTPSAAHYKKIIPVHLYFQYSGADKLNYRTGSKTIRLGIVIKIQYCLEKLLEI